MLDPFQNKALEKDPLAERPYDPERNREVIRGSVALFFTLIFAVVIGFYAWGSLYVADDAHWSRFKDTFGVLLPAVTSVLGTVLGFYFGAQKR